MLPLMEVSRLKFYPIEESGSVVLFLFLVDTANDTANDTEFLWIC